MLLNTQVTRTFACFGAFMLRNVFSLSAALICVKLQEYRACAGSWNYGVFGCVAFTMKGKVCKRLGYTALNYFYRYILNLFFFFVVKWRVILNFSAKFHSSSEILSATFLQACIFIKCLQVAPLHSRNALRTVAWACTLLCKPILYNLSAMLQSGLKVMISGRLSTPGLDLTRSGSDLTLWLLHFFSFSLFFFCFMITAAPSALLTYTLDAGETLQSGRWDKSHF